LSAARRHEISTWLLGLSECAGRTAAAVCLITKTEAFVPDDGRADYNAPTGTTTATATPDTRRLSYNGRLDGTYMIDGGTFQLP